MASRNGKTKAITKGKLRVCGRAKSNGEPCTQLAGHGTDHEGKGACRWHDKDQRGMVATTKRLGVPTAVSPGEAIQGVLNLASGQLLYVSAQVAGLDEGDIFTEAGRSKWIGWQERLMDRVARYAATAVGMGLAERQGQLAEQQTRMMAAILEGVMGEVGLTPTQRKKVGPAIRKHLSSAIETTGEQAVGS